MRSFSSDEHIVEVRTHSYRFPETWRSLLSGYFILLGGSSPFTPLGIHINF